MSKAYFVVRSVVNEPLRKNSIIGIRPITCRRRSSTSRRRKAGGSGARPTPIVHYAVYQFADQAKLDAAMKGDVLKALIADFDRNFPSVARTRDFLTMAEELSA